MTGRLIAVEGINGAGKTTLARALAAWLHDRGHDVVETREPGGSTEATAAGSALRGLLVERTAGPLVPLAEAFGFELDRAQTYSTLIRPALARGKWVVSDRNYFGTIAYQGCGRGVDLELIERMSAAALQGPPPDRSIVLDLPVAAARRRRAASQAAPLDAELAAVEESIRVGYVFAANRAGSGARILDATQSIREVLEEAKRVVGELL